MRFHHYIIPTFFIFIMTSCGPLILSGSNKPTYEEGDKCYNPKRDISESRLVPYFDDKIALKIEDDPDFEYIMNLWSRKSVYFKDLEIVKIDEKEKLLSFEYGFFLDSDGEKHSVLFEVPYKEDIYKVGDRGSFKGKILDGFFILDDWIVRLVCAEIEILDS